MSNQVSKPGRSLSDRIYQLLLAFYPAEFRYEYSAQMAQAFRDQCREAKRRAGLAGLARLWAYTLVDLIVTTIREHRDTIAQDLRFGVRMLSRTPGFTAMAVLTLTLGIGANSAIFSVINGVLLRPLDIEDPDRVMMIFERQGGGQSSVAPSNFLIWRNQAQAFEDIAAFIQTNFNLTGGDEPEQIEGVRASAGLFPLLRTKPILGRTFLEEEDKPGTDRVVILSHKLWQRQFGSDSKAIGQSLTLDGNSFTVIGVMPADYNFPDTATELWTPLALDRSGMNAISGRILNTVARLKPDATLEQAQTEMNTIMSGLEQEDPGFNKGWSAVITPLQELIVKGIRPSLLILLGAVGFILLIACANVANLLLARAAARQKEIAIRIAIGASHLRLIRQLLTESLLLALLGGALGLLLALWGVQALVALSPGNIPRMDRISIDGSVLAFTLLISLLTGVIFGLVPALQASKPDLNESLKEGGKKSAIEFGLSPVRKLLVVAEVALSLVLLIGAGLMIKSILRLQNVNPGFNTAGVVTMSITLPETKYRENDRIVNFYHQVLDRLRRLPGVESIGTTHSIPLSGGGSSRIVVIEGRPVPEPGKLLPIQYRVISPNYFRTMQIPLRAGRDFNDQDTAQTPGVAIINESAARQYWPGEDPIGKRIKHNTRDEDPWLTIVGIAGDVMHYGLGEDDQPTVYWTYAQAPLLNSPTIEQRRRSVNLMIRTAADSSALMSAVRHEVMAVDKDMPVYGLSTMQEHFDKSFAYRRYITLLLGIFAAVAVMLAAVGIYGVISYSVARRTHEIGIRLAMGAQQRDILKLVVGQAMALALSGVTLGVIAAFALTRIISGLLYEVRATDAATFISVSALATIIALLACYFPARRASKIDPIVALRYE